VTSRKPYYLTDFTDPKRLKEKAIEAMCISIYRQFNVYVVKFSQPHRASQTLGIPDLLCYWQKVPEETDTLRDKPYGIAWTQKWWHEVKRFNHKPTPHQLIFHKMVEHYSEMVIVGGLNTAIAQLRDLGIAELGEVEGHW